MRLAEVLHIPPWDLDRLTVAQLDQAVAALEQLDAEHSKGR